MNRFLIIDIGAGTMDILCYDKESELHYKAVVKSPVRSIAEKAELLKGNIIVMGNEMGGGRLSEILKQKAEKNRVVMTKSASKTISHDIEKVRSSGIEIVEDAQGKSFASDKNFNKLYISDIDPKRIKKIVEGLGIKFSFDIVGICAQDHGVSPKSVSNKDFRNQIFGLAFKNNPRPEELIYPRTKIPNFFNRLNSIAESARLLQAKQIYVMDSAMAAVLGASLDIEAKSKDTILVVDVATSHTVCAILEKGEIAGFFEYHTRDITADKLDSLIMNLAQGSLSHQQILNEGGHGVYIRKAVSFENIQILIGTGPKRSLLKDSKLAFRFGAPLGDNMMTGTAGLLEAVKRYLVNG